MKVYIVLSTDSGVPNLEIVTVKQERADEVLRLAVIENGSIWTESEVKEDWGEGYLGTDSSEFLYVKKQTDDGDDVYYAIFTHEFDIRIYETEVEDV